MMTFASPPNSMMILRKIMLFGLLLLTACIPSAHPLITDNHVVYLPILISNPYHPIFGTAVINKSWDDWGQYYKGDILKVPIDVFRVKPSPAVAANFSIQDEWLKNRDIRYLIIKTAPEWMNGGQPVCKLPVPEYWDEWVAVALEAIARYDVDYVSIWNEPDTTFAGLSEHFGCLGEDYESGVMYAEFFNFIYEAIKREYHQVNILAGELMNVNTPFARGMLETVIAAEGLAFHHYAWCNLPSSLSADIELADSLTELPLWLSETSLICAYNDAIVEFQQLNYYMEVRNRPELDGAIWFTLNDTGWLYSGMLQGERLKLVGCAYTNMCE